MICHRPTSLLTNVYNLDSILLPYVVRWYTISLKGVLFNVWQEAAELLYYWRPYAIPGRKEFESFDQNAHVFNAWVKGKEEGRVKTIHQYFFEKSAFYRALCRTME